MENIYKDKYLKYKNKYLNKDKKNFYNIVPPYNSGLLEVDNIHKIYYEESGNPNGKPIIVIHGGPGSGSGNKYSKFYDLSKNRLIAMDQRGCGKSLPFGELKNNTTWDLINDIEKLREYLKIDKWYITGGSWGSTLCLLYAIKFPDKILGIAISAICLLRQEEINWLYKKGGLSQIYPKEWEEFNNYIPENERDDLVKAYHKRLNSNDINLIKEASKYWSHYELNCVFFNQSDVKELNLEDYNLLIPLAKIESHYFINKAFLPTDNYILENIDIIKNIPMIIIQSRYDVICPFVSAYDLHKALPNSKLVISPSGGHSKGDYPTCNLYINEMKNLLEN